MRTNRLSVPDVPAQSKQAIHRCQGSVRGHYLRGVVTDAGSTASGRTLRFAGGRFAAERLSDEAFAAAGRSLLAYRDAVVELAKQEHSTSLHGADGGVPPSISGFQFCITDLREGSLLLDVRPDGDPEMFEIEDPCSRSADKIETAIAELGREGQSETLASLPPDVVGLIAKIGDPLTHSEAVSFASSRGTARLGASEREILRAPALRTVVSLDVIAGRVLRISADRSRASLSVLGWPASRTTSIFYGRLSTIDQMRAALTPSDESGPLVTVVGPFKWSAGKLELDGSGSALDAVTVHDDEAAERLTAFVGELDELQRLEAGWYSTDGEAGTAPRADAILGARRLSASFAHHALPYPDVFPAVNGGVSLEWTLGKVEASIRFEDSSETATVASWDAATDEHRYEERVTINDKFVSDWLHGITGQPAR